MRESNNLDNPTVGKTPTKQASAELDNAANVEDIDQVADAPVGLLDELPGISDLLPESFQPYLELVQQYPLLEALIILSGFWALAFLLRRFAISLLQRLAGKTANELDDHIIDELRRPIFTTIVWIGVLVAAASSGATSGVMRFITPLVMTFIVMIWLRVSLRLSGTIFDIMSHDPDRFKKVNVGTKPLLIIVSKIVVLLIACYILLEIWGINPVGLLASAGIVGIAVGFAAKDTLANLFSGVFILADRPYKLGDYVNLDSGERGKVTHIGIRSTRILTRDDIEVTVPNGVIGNAKIVNESSGTSQKMRIRIPVQCNYAADLDLVCDLLMNIAAEESMICEFPDPRVRIRNFAENGISIQLMGWIEKPEDRGRITHIMLKKIHQVFAENGLDIPYPKRDITITNRNQPE